MRAAVLVLIAACGGSSAKTTDGGPSGSDDCSAIPAAESGDGTYYDADGTGNCSFDASPDDLMVAAMNAPDYDNSAWCGACLAITGPMATITVRVVDQCPGCAHGDLDLSETAFGMIAPLSAGRVPITWHEVACDVTGPIAYQFKDGSNAYYAAIQIRDARYPIDTVEVNQGGTYSLVPRQSYNYFVQSGLGAGPFDLRVTDARGQVLEDTGIALGADVTRMGASQFDTCSD
jgi:expansin (peptidoglycan-binding protein)